MRERKRGKKEDKREKGKMREWKKEAGIERNE